MKSIGPQSQLAHYLPRKINHVLLLVVALTLSCSKRERINANGMRDAFAESLQLSLEANRLTQPPEGKSSFQMPKSQEDHMLSLIDQALQKTNFFDSKFLTWLHSELPSTYMEKFIEGQQLYTQGIRSNNPAMQIKGNQLLMDWQHFWETHKLEITAKMYPD